MPAITVICSRGRPESNWKSVEYRFEELIIFSRQILAKFDKFRFPECDSLVPRLSPPPPKLLLPRTDRKLIENLICRGFRQSFDPRRRREIKVVRNYGIVPTEKKYVWRDERRRRSTRDVEDSRLFYLLGAAIWHRRGNHVKVSIKNGNVCLANWNGIK